MTDPKSSITRRDMLGKMGKVAAAAIAMPVLKTTIFSSAADAAWRAGAAVNGIAGIDRVVVLPGKTYLRGWAGYGEPPRRGPRRPQPNDTTPPQVPPGPPPKVKWTKQSGPGKVTFADPSALITTATFSAPGAYTLELTADDGQAKASSTLTVKVEHG